jgi:hypothetical protein
MKTTKHAETQMRRLGIPKLIPEFLEIFSCEETQKGGVIKLRLTEKSQKRAIEELKIALKALQNSKSYFSVVNAEGLVITTGHLFAHR